jgi:hypothetical protein
VQRRSAVLEMVYRFGRYFELILAMYFAERVYREIRGRYPTTITKVVQHPSKVPESNQRSIIADTGI